ncbi:MAG: hypothetical protein NXI32_00130 [bacterium]|nr:hypothetical protein [bacterium]
MEQVKKGLKVKDLIEATLRWQACQCGDDDLRLAVRQALRQRLPDYQVEMLEDGALPDKIIEAIADDLAKNLSPDAEKIGGFSLDSIANSSNSRLPSQAVLEVELLPEPQIVAPEENIPRFRMDPISLYHGLDGIIRFLTWDCLSLPGFLVVACVAAVASLPFVLENPEFSKDGSPLFPFGQAKPRQSQYSKQPAREVGRPADSAALTQSEERGGSEDSENAHSRDDDQLVEFIPDTQSIIPTEPAEAKAGQSANEQSLAQESSSDLSKSESPTMPDASEDQELDLDALLAPILAESAAEESSESAEAGKGKTEDQKQDDNSKEQSSVEDQTALLEATSMDRHAGDESPVMEDPSSPSAPAEIPSLSSLPVHAPAVSDAISDLDQPDPPTPGFAVDQRPVLHEANEQPNSDLSEDSLESSSPSMAAEGDNASSLATAAISPVDILVLLEQGDLDAVLAITFENFDTQPQRTDCLLLVAEAGIRKGDFDSKLKAWSILSTANTSPVADLLCARLLLGSRESERRQFAAEISEHPLRGKLDRYVSWLNSWDADSDNSVRKQLQRFMLQYPETSCIDSIFMANAHFAKRDFVSAYRGLAAANDRIQSLSLPTETAAQTWLLETSVRELRAKMQGSLRGLSSKLTKTAEIGNSSMSGQK